MDSKDFSIDSRAKYGEADWEEDGDFDNFVSALNRGATVRADGVPSEAGAPADISVDEAALSELRAIFSKYYRA